MRKGILIVAALAAAGLGGCIAVPVAGPGPGPYYGDTGYYYPAPAVGVGIYAPPAYYGYGRPHRHWRRW